MPPLRLPLLATLFFSAFTSLAAAPVGEFDSAADSGKISLPGSAEVVPATGQYRITGSGASMWAKEDAFHFLS